MTIPETAGQPGSWVEGGGPVSASGAAAAAASQRDPDEATFSAVEAAE